LSQDWWAKLVVPSLSYQQAQRAAQRGSGALADLDLAALLRVLDQNWFEISQAAGLPREVRHYVKEMQSVRNRWAHAGSGAAPVDDLYRDLDTAQRLASAVGVRPELVAKIAAAKADLLGSPDTLPAPKPEEAPQERVEDGLQVGQVVCLRADPSVTGAVIGYQPGQPEDRFTVFLNTGAKGQYYASQLQRVAESQPATEILPVDLFHASLTSRLLLQPSLASLYSLNSARIDFVPYQFRPVLRFIRADRPRMLIADGVGVGKTIEAGLILRELQARREVRSVLVICPKALVTERKWQLEMRRFDEHFAHLDSAALRYCLHEADADGVWPEQYAKAIVPYSLLDEECLYGRSRKGKTRRVPGLLDLDPPPRFDLVIVDEAHHVRNPATLAHQAVRFFCENSEAVLFLTATPIQLGSQDLFVLLNLLRPDLVIDRDSYDFMAEPNRHVSLAAAAARRGDQDWQKETLQALFDAAATSWGRQLLAHDPEFVRAVDALSSGPATKESRVATIDAIEQLNTFSRIINRTRRKDIGEFAVRKPETVCVDFTPAQRSLHDAVLDLQARILGHIHGDAFVRFLISTVRRQAASCLFGLVPLLEEILKRHLGELAGLDDEEAANEGAEGILDSVESEIRELLERAKNLDKKDPKLDALLEVVRGKLALPNKRVMVFSSFRHTLAYLQAALARAGVRVAVVHGSTPDEERLAVRDRFSLPSESADALDVLLFSEVGSEGLDYQFCDFIVNYDIPWNPMRVEQRIGRIDRKGQRSDAIAIYNFITPGTVDAEIYTRCFLRIGVFESALGASEEILGDLAQRLRDVAESLSLSEQERAAKLEQLADNYVRLTREQTALEEHEAELLGINLPPSMFRAAVEEASSFWLSGKALELLVRRYLEATCGAAKEYILGSQALKSLRVAQEGRDVLLRDYQKLARQQSPLYREWERWLKGADPHLAVTFDSACASAHPEAILLSPVHPLARQAATATQLSEPVLTALAVESELVREGRYPFALYGWRFHGVRDDFKLQPVAAESPLVEHFPELLVGARQADMRPAEFPARSIFDSLDQHHHSLWSKARHEHRERTRQLSEYRAESLKASHSARVRVLEEQRDGATNQNIRRMRQAQLDTAEADFARRCQELELAAERAELTAQPVAFGVIEVSSPSHEAPAPRTDRAR